MQQLQLACKRTTQTCMHYAKNDQGRVGMYRQTDNSIIVSNLLLYIPMYGRG